MHDMNRKATIICKHVIADPSCAKFAVRMHAEDVADSGWQVLCDRNAHYSEDAKIVSLDELKNLIPSITSILETPCPCMFAFENGNWIFHENQDGSQGKAT